MTRELLGRLVRQTWVAWARDQPDWKPSWLTEWDDLDAGQREVDMRIGEDIAGVAAGVERARIMAGVTAMRDHALNMADLIGDGVVSVGYHAQDEALTAVLALISDG